MSIKRKFATAIATAGLLAGLFGSAFVPSALAARTIDTDASYAFEHSGYFGNTAADGELAVSSNYSDGNLARCYDGDYYDYSEDCKLPERLQISSFVDYGVAPERPLFAGGSGSGLAEQVLKYDEAGYAYADDFSIGIKLIDDEGDDVTSADLSATVTGGKIKVAFAYLENGDHRVPCWNPDLRSEFKTTGDAVNDADSDGGDYNTYAGDGDQAAGEFFLCIRAASETTLGTSNVTIKADGDTIWSGSVQVIGDLDKIDLTVRDGYNRVAAGNAEDSLFFKVVMEDAAGQAICGTADGFANDCEDDDYLGDYDDELSYYARGSSPEDIFEDFEVGQDGEAGLAADACVTADAGDTKTAAAWKDNFHGERVISNTVSIVCTEAQSKFVVAATGITQEYSNPILSGEADWSASAQGEDDATGHIEIYAVIKDSTGALMGVDSSTGFYSDMDYTIDGNGDLNIDGYDGDADAIGVGGKVVLGDYDPEVGVAAKFEIEVKFADGNGATAGSQAVAKSLYYLVSALDLDYTLTRVRNAAKTSATWTVDWGLDCSNAIVYFDWVNKNGTKGTLVNGASPVSRRANFDGVATFTLKKRNMTIFVTAYACDDFGDTPDELGPVKARFR